MEIGVDYTRDVVLLAVGLIELVGKYCKSFGLVDIKPVTYGGQHIHDKHKSSSNVGRGEPRACEWASEVGGDSGPVEAQSADAKPVKARAELLGQDWRGEYPADPREGSQHFEKVAWEDIVREAAGEGNEEELGPGHPSFGPFFFLVQSPVMLVQTHELSKKIIEQNEKWKISTF